MNMTDKIFVYITSRKQGIKISAVSVIVCILILVMIKPIKAQNT